MATSDELSRETMIARHMPPVHGDSLGCDVYTAESKLRRPCSLSLTHSISLPERENLPNEALNGDFQGHASESSAKERTGISDPGSGNTRGYDSAALFRHDLFALKSEAGENCDTYGTNNLHKCCKAYSLCQRGNLNGTKDKYLRYDGKPWSLCCSQDDVSNTSCIRNIRILEHLRTDEQIVSVSGLQLCRGNEDTPILMDCEEQDWADLYVPNVTNAFSDCESSNRNQTDYISDSSCNSSDGVLVNFSAIYNKTNNAVPATPYDLDRPAKKSQKSMHQDDELRLNPCWFSCGVDPNCNIYQADCNGSQDISDLTPCQGQLTTYTNNYYKLVTCDLSSQSADSPAWSSLTSCSEGHSNGSTTPPSEYFLFKRTEPEDREVVELDQRDVQADEDTERKRSKGTRKTSKKINKRKIHTRTHYDKCKDLQANSHELASVSRSWNSKPCLPLTKQEGLRRVLSCPGQINLSSHALLARCKRSGKSPSVVKDCTEDSAGSQFSQNISPVQMEDSLGQKATFSTDRTEKESGRSENSSEPPDIPPPGVPESSVEVVRYTKPQRPTSLPVQPFVLQPPSLKQSSKGLCSLVDQYMSHRLGAPESTDLSSQLALSPLDDLSSIHLEVASCSVTCSTCTPTPTEPHIHPHWAPPGLVQTCPSVKPCEIDREKTSVGSFPNKPSKHLQASSHLESAPRSRVFPYCSSSPATTSVTSLTSDSSFRLPGAARTDSDAVRHEELDAAAVHRFGAKTKPCFLGKEQHQHGDSSSLADRPPEEFCSSPDPSATFHPIDLLQRKEMLKSLSAAVDLITAHFSSSTDPNQKFRLGNSSLCPRISRLVLDQLCPAFRDVLQDGLRPFKLDVIVGRRSNKPWSVVEAATRPGPSTRMLHSLVSVVKKCSKLTDHSMRLNAFVLGLLNLSALESWFWHLHTCADVIAEYYHPWAFLALSQDSSCKSVFQELLLLLQPLSELPFDLHLLSESRLQRRPEPIQSSIQHSAFLALSGCSFLNWQNSDGHLERSKSKEKKGPRIPSQTSRSTNMHKILQSCAVTISKASTQDLERKSGCLKKNHAGWWLSQTPMTERVMETGVSDDVPGVQNTDTLVGNADATRTDKVKPRKELRWARLFGSRVGNPVEVEKAQQCVKQNQKIRPPSQWLQLGASKMDQLAQSVWSKETSRTLCRPQIKQ